MEWFRKRPTVHFIKLLFLLAILLWISSFFRHADGAAATTKEIVFVIEENQYMIDIFKN